MLGTAPTFLPYLVLPSFHPSSPLIGSHAGLQWRHYGSKQRRIRSTEAQRGLSAYLLQNPLNHLDTLSLDPFSNGITDLFGVRGKHSRRSERRMSVQQKLSCNPAGHSDGERHAGVAGWVAV